MLAVLDMGGGTCDVAVMRHRAGAGAPGDAAGTRVEVLSFGGIDDLGGVLLDRMMGDHVEQVLVRRGRAELLEALADPRRLRDRRTFADAVRTAKHQLSDRSWAEVPVVVGEHDDVVMLTESDFGSLVADPVRRAVALLEQGVLEAGLTPDRLDAVYLTGGSSHLRPLQVAVDDLIGMAHSSREDPKLVVSLGALETTDRTHVVPPAPRPLGTAPVEWRSLVEVPDSWTPVETSGIDDDGDPFGQVTFLNEADDRLPMRVMFAPRTDDDDLTGDLDKIEAARCSDQAATLLLTLFTDVFGGHEGALMVVRYLVDDIEVIETLALAYLEGWSFVAQLAWPADREDGPEVTASVLGLSFRTVVTQLESLPGDFVLRVPEDWTLESRRDDDGSPEITRSDGQRRVVRRRRCAAVDDHAR